jgi:hypothetical protein
LFIIGLLIEYLDVSVVVQVFVVLKAAFLPCLTIMLENLVVVERLKIIRSHLPLILI